MRSNISIHVTAADRKRLEDLVADRNTPAKVVWRAQIILATVDGVNKNEAEARRHFRLAAAQKFSPQDAKEALAKLEAAIEKNTKAEP